MSDDLKKDLEEFEGQLTTEMYQDLLGKSYEKIATLRSALATTENQEIVLRDRIATHIYPTMMLQSTSPEQAAQDSYRAADNMLG